MITLATAGKFWYIQEFSGGGYMGGSGEEDAKRKPAISIGEVRSKDLDEEGGAFKIIKIVEKDL